MDTATLYTVGHSNRSMSMLVEVLRAADIGIVVDVRAHPQSQRHPEYSMDGLRAALEAVGIAYHWAGRPLGGRRNARSGSPHTALADVGLRGYADYMDTDAFTSGIAQLLNVARTGPTAILCAERDPQQCHRSLIADYLTLQGMRVIHLIEPGPSCVHALRPEVRRESARLVYDRFTTGDLKLDGGGGD